MTRISLGLICRKLGIIVMTASALVSAQTGSTALARAGQLSSNQSSNNQPATDAITKQTEKWRTKVELRSTAAICGASALTSKKYLSKKAEEKVYEIGRKVEYLESKELFGQAANQYLEAKKIIAQAEGSCSTNSGRASIIYGSKLYRAFRLEEAEKQLKHGLDALRLNNIATKETCEDATGGIQFLNEIYTKKLDSKSFADAILASWPFLEKCLESQAEATKPKLFDIFIRLSLDIFNGYAQEKTESLKNERAELAFDALNKAYYVVDGKPTQMQMADILLKEGYFKYLMADGLKNKKRTDLLLRAKEATSQALRIHDELNKPDNAASSAKQLAYILDSLGEYAQAENLYKGLLVRALEKPLRATTLEEDYTLLSGYAAFTKDWNRGASFGSALLKLRQWEYVALKKLLPLITPKERLEYLSLFSTSEELAARGFAQGSLTAEEYLDSFLQLRYSLIESELIALGIRSQKISAPQIADFTSASKEMEILDIGFTEQIKRSLKNNELFIQLVEAAPEKVSTGIISSNKIVTKTQAFVVRNSVGPTSPSAYKICEQDLCKRLLTNALDSTSEGLADAPQQWRMLMDNVFTPSLIKEIRGSDLLYLGLDGSLQRIPIGIVRTYLESKGLESLRIIPVQSLADIANQGRTLQGGNSIVFYSPEFGEKTGCRLSNSCQRQWRTLPYSLKEGEAVSKIITGRKLFGVNASKPSILAIKSPRILHISSHAGFAEDTQSEHLSAHSSLGQAQLLDGLYNLYIVASGANVHPPKASIITTTDLADLNLSGTSLVVVSACETGLGESKRGYGLFGMHRILSSVGAESTLLSMWKVDDEATSVLMSMFYDNLKAGYTVDQSLARAQDRMSQDPKLVSRGWAHPYYWAGWQIAGMMNPVFKE